VQPPSARLQPRAQGLRRPVSRPPAPRGHRLSQSGAGTRRYTTAKASNTLPRPRDRPWRRKARADGASVPQLWSRAVKHDLGALELRADDERRQQTAEPSKAYCPPARGQCAFRPASSAGSRKAALFASCVSADWESAAAAGLQGKCVRGGVVMTRRRRAQRPRPLPASPKHETGVRHAAV